MTQQDYDNKMYKLHGDLAVKMKEVIEIQNSIAEHRANADLILIEHALIPKGYSTIEEWLEGHPFPETVNKMRFKNYATAMEVQHCCNTYQFDYHIVKTKNKTI